MRPSPIVVPLLPLAVGQGMEAAYATHLLALFGVPPAIERVYIPDTGATLTERELEVLRLVAAGASNHAIAGQLVISLPTVKNHIAHILAKLNAISRGEAAARAHQLRRV